MMYETRRPKTGLHTMNH